jgi:Flp pilus assembly protein TadD
MAEHRVYGASIGIFLAAGSAFGMLSYRFDRRGPVRRWVLYGLAALFVVQLCGRTIIRNAIWGDPVRLSREAIGLSPDHWMPRLLLGEALRTTGRCDEAVAEYRIAITLRPREEFGYTKLAGCLIASGRLDEATTAFEQLGSVNPSSTVASTGLGFVAILRNRPAEGRAYFSRTVERDPSDWLGQQLLAFVDGTLDPGETVAICAELKRLAPATAVSDACVPGTHAVPQPQDQ